MLRPYTQACCAPTPKHAAPLHPSMLRPYTQACEPLVAGTGALQPALQEPGCQPLQPARNQREAVGHEEQAEHDQQDAGDALDPDEIWSEPLEPDEKPVERQRGEEEGNGEPDGIGGEARRAVPRRISSSSSVRPVRNPT